MKAVVAWSSGKDSAYALHVARENGEVEIVGALTTLTEPFERVSMHGVREALLDRQMAEADLTCTKVRIPSPCSNEIYDARMAAAMETLKAEGVTHVIFGDLFLEDIRAYREERLTPLGVTSLFPLWQRDTTELAREMVSSGVRAIVTCVDPRVLPASFAGRVVDASFLADLPEGVDPCGENGEFHTVVVEGPMFRHPIEVERGEVVERGGFVFADVIPTANTP